MAKDKDDQALHDAAMKWLRERSGNVTYDDRLVSFLYELMRDHVPPGVVETVVLNSMIPEVKYTNGWLASYAFDIAKRLRSMSAEDEFQGFISDLTDRTKTEEPDRTLEKRLEYLEEAVSVLIDVQQPYADVRNKISRNLSHRRRKKK